MVAYPLADGFHIMDLGANNSGTRNSVIFILMACHGIPLIVMVVASVGLIIDGLKREVYYS